MPSSGFTALACPLDQQALHHDGNALRCAAGHCFDVASQGYTNLLPVQKKRSLDPGDSKEMVASRRRFLNAGHYEPIAAAVSRATLTGNESSNQPVSLSCLDAGCGEGYYLRQLCEVAHQQNQALSILGLDISKWAVIAAAKQAKQATWVVGSNANLPVLPGTLDRVLCMFGFPVYTEFARVLKPGGLLIQVDAGPDHLRELREVIYPTLKPAREAASDAPLGFCHLDTQSVGYAFPISGKEPIADLLAMTPHLYRATAEGRARAAALTEIRLTVDVQIARFVRA